MIQTITWHTLEPGPHLLITGGIHGNEPSGTIGIEAVTEYFKRGAIHLKRGILTMIPVCNPEARARKTRYFERNLNRHFYPKEHPLTYEDRICNILTPYFEGADILVDIHSYTAGGPSFSFLGPLLSPEEKDLSRMLGIEHATFGFENAYKNAGIESSEKESMGTAEYFRSQGGYSLTLECGQHDDPQSAAIAERAILGALHHLGLAEISQDLQNKVPPMTPAGKVSYLEAVNVFYKTKDGKITEKLKHLSPFQAGEILAEYEDGERILAPHAGYMILPHSTSPVGEEWFYIAKKVNF